MFPSLLIYKPYLFWKINIISKEICKNDVRQVHFVTKNRREPLPNLPLSRPGIMAGSCGLVGCVQGRGLGARSLSRVFFIIFFIYSWPELLHFVIMVSIYIMVVNGVLHWGWGAICLLGSFGGALLVVSILDVVYDCHW